MLAHEVPAEVEQAIRQLTITFEAQADEARREYVKKCLRSYEFFRGNQLVWWDRRSGELRSATDVGDLGVIVPPEIDAAAGEYVVNIYQGFAMSVIAILTANMATQTVLPEDAENDVDRAAAEKANDFLDIFHRTSNSHERLLDQTFRWWTDGTFGSYVHTVTDGSRFGWTEEDISEDVPTPVGYDTYKCEACGMGSAHPGEKCPACGAPYGPNAMQPAPVVNKPTVVGKRRTPKSRVVWDVVPGVELKLPPNAKNQAEFPFILRSREVPLAITRYTYPELADRISVSSEQSTRGLSADAYETRARRQMAMGTTTQNRGISGVAENDVTLREVWLRHWAFWQLDDSGTRDKLLELFPDGARAVFAGDTLCEVIPESMDDRWRIAHALPGHGQVREPIGGTLIQIQEIVNDLTNIIRDIIEHSIPATFADQEVFDPQAWAQSKVTPGGVYSVRARANRSVQEAFYNTQPAQLPQYATGMLAEMRTQVPQFTVGAFPAAYGGGTPGNSTASGIASERDAAMGRLGIYWRILKEHHSEVAVLLVKEFAKNSDPMTVVEESEGGAWVNLTVSPEEVAAGKVQAHAEATEDYPTTWSQRQAQVMQAFQNPLLQQDVMKLRNWDYVKRMLGIDLKHAGEDAYRAQWKIIEQLVTQQPIPVMEPVMQPVMDPMTGQPAVDPMTGQPQMQPVVGPNGQPAQQQAVGPDGKPAFEPSIKPGELDDQGPMLEACMDFDMSDRGLELKVQNPQGYQNFVLHTLLRKQAMQPPQAMPQGGGQAPPQGGPPGPPGAAG